MKAGRFRLGSIPKLRSALQKFAATVVSIREHLVRGDFEGPSQVSTMAWQWRDTRDIGALDVGLESTFRYKDIARSLMMNMCVSAISVPRREGDETPWLRFATNIRSGRLLPVLARAHFDTSILTALRSGVPANRDHIQQVTALSPEVVEESLKRMLKSGVEEVSTGYFLARNTNAEKNDGQSPVFEANPEA